MSALFKSDEQRIDITKCPLCSDAFQEPKVLPCAHTFCLQCISTNCDKNSENVVSCPICKKIYSIPIGGTQDLPSNFFVQQILEVNKSTDVAEKQAVDKEHLCEWCSDVKALATSYYAECDQHICDRCSMIHNNIKVNRSHRVKLLKDLPSSDESTKLVASHCDQHPDEKNRFYCNDCKVVMCPSCLEEQHSSHSWADLNKSAEKFRNQLKEQVEKVWASAFDKQEQAVQLKIDMRVFMKKVADTEREIASKYNELVSIMQSHQSQLLEELLIFKKQILKRMETEKDEIEKQFEIAESFKGNCFEIIKEGSAGYIACMAPGLIARAEELMKAQDKPHCEKFREIEISFEPSIAKIESAWNFIGRLNLKEKNETSKKNDIDGENAFDSMLLLNREPSDDKSDLTTSDLSESVELNLTKEQTPSKNKEDVKTLKDKSDTITTNEKSDLRKFLNPSLLHVLPSNGLCVNGITALGDDIFIVQNTSQIQVYDATSFQSKGNIVIPGAHRLQGIASCAYYNCIYVSNFDDILFRYNLTNSITTKWPLPATGLRMSVTDCHTLLVTMNDGKVEEFTTNGQSIREIPVSISIASIDNYWIRLSTGNYIISNSSDLHLVNTFGRSIEIAEKRPLTGDVYMTTFNSCHLLAADVHDNVLVTVSYSMSLPIVPVDSTVNAWMYCETINKVNVVQKVRIMLLSSTLADIGTIVIPDLELIPGRTDPTVAHYDQERNRLYIRVRNVNKPTGDVVYILEPNAEN